jgi:hypothetical protein
VTPIRLQFPLSADPKRDAALRPSVERAVRTVVDAVGPDRIEAVVLAGSLARGEASVLLEAGTFRLLGDMEFLIVMRDASDWARTRREMATLSAHVTRSLREAGETATVEYTPAGLSYLRRAIRPCIFAHDLIHTGKVVWGRPDVLSEVRAFDARDIPREDALRLLMNRVVELMLPEESATGAEEWREPYQLVKVILDLSGSAVAFAGRHSGSYAARAAALTELLAACPDLARALPRTGEFVEALRWATLCKLEPSEEALLRRPEALDASLVSRWAQALWIWESRRLLDRPEGTFMELLQAYVRHEPVAARLRGWVKLWLHPLRPAKTLSISRTARWILRASPQRLTYGAALIAVWGGGSPGASGQPEAAVALLPIRRRSGASSVARSEIADLWRWLVRTN